MWRDTYSSQRYPRVEGKSTTDRLSVAELGDWTSLAHECKHAVAISVISRMIATVLVKRGTLTVGSTIIAGQAWAKVRAMSDDKGKAVKQIGPGFPVIVTGWKELPNAGDEVIEVPKKDAESMAKKAIANRKRQTQIAEMVEDVGRLNQTQREAHAAAKEKAEEKAAYKAARFAYRMGLGPAPAPLESVVPSQFTVKKTEEEEKGIKVVNIVVKGDVSGTVEAVVETLSTIGNNEVQTKIISSGVGDITPGDVELAQTANGKYTCVFFLIYIYRYIYVICIFFGPCLQSAVKHQ